MRRDRFEVVRDGRRHAILVIHAEVGNFPPVKLRLPRGQVLRLAARLIGALANLEPLPRAK